MCVWVRNSANSQPLQTQYTVQFPETTGTLSDMLIVGNAKYRYLTDISLNGLYNITVSNTSSIVKSNNSVTYDYNLTNLPATNNGITDNSVTYTSPRVIIRYKTKKTTSTPYTPSGLLEDKDSNWVVSNYPLLDDIPGQLSYSQKSGTPTIPTTLSQLSGTIAYSSVTDTPAAPAAATFTSTHPVDVWLNSGDKNGRVFYSRDSTTYYKGGGDIPHIWQDDTGTEIMRLKKNVTLGIGISLTQARLHVAAGAATTELIIQTYFDKDTTALNTPQNRATTDLCAIFESFIWCKSRFTSSSDNRIKKNIEDITDDSALQKILEIQPKTYNYIDVVNRGDKKVYGFIAQQINEVLPEAVAIEKNIIPNIYEVCDCSLNKIYVNVMDISENTNIDIIDLSGNRKTYFITEITENYITVDKEIIGEQCFVYGYEVNDFHTIDKSYIFTLNVCATQELHRKIIIQRTEIDELKEK